MQKVITINLNGNAYQLDETAYGLLRTYLDGAERQLKDNPDNAEIVATFYTDPRGNVHVDNEAFYDIVRGIRDPATGRRIDGHAGIAFLHAVRNYFRGPGTWAGEVVPLFPAGSAGTGTPPSG